MELGVLFERGVLLNGLALCSGVGGLERGIASVFRNYKTVCHVEGEAYAVACLVSQMEKGFIHEAPVWSNVRTFNGKAWIGKVDIISGGFPCQPFSQAGKQKGIDDERYLWPSISKIISQIRPSIVILENVPIVLNHAGKIIFGDLAKMGYNSSWCVIRASDAEAPHRRERFFSISIHSNSYNDGFPISFIKEESYDRILEERKIQGSCFERLCSNVSNTHSNSKSNKSINVKQRGIFQKSEHWKVEPGVGRMADGVAHWVDRLRACGNGVVPQQAKLALEILISNLNLEFKDSKL